MPEAAAAYGLTPAHLRDTETRRDSDGETPVLFGAQATLDDYVARAAALDPALRATYTRWRAAGMRSSVATPWPRPTVSYSAFLRPVETRVGAQRQRIGVHVPIQWGGPRQATRHAAALAASATGHTFGVRLLALRREIAERYWRLWEADRLLEANQAQQDIVRALGRLADSRIVAGGGTLTDVQQLALRLSLLEEQGEEHRLVRAQQERALRTRLGLTDGSALPVSASAPARPTLPEREALYAHLAERPEQQALADRANSEEARAEGLRRRWAPDLAFRADYIQVQGRNSGAADDGNDALALGFSLSIPTDAGVFRTRARAAEAEAEALRQEAAHRVREARIALDDNLLALERARASAERIEGPMMAQAEAALSARLARFATVGGLTDVLAIAQDLLSLREAKVRAEARFARRYAHIEWLVGVPLAPLRTAEDVDATSEAVTGSGVNNEETEPTSNDATSQAAPPPAGTADPAETAEPSEQAAPTRRRRARPTYTCPMHPHVRQHRPGACPICGMDLVRSTTPSSPRENNARQSGVSR